MYRLHSKLVYFLKLVCLSKLVKVTDKVKKSLAYVKIGQ